ncbi:S9 family peptidase [Natronospira bacteriovora]|uniref:S9 family peptidase n=1 Tax=Natronospira bacteriovora TaxID=3069753 RepID=A0ABU0W622_9GAMM|nr:S9 family peptidase [Natronospira sp. AB-CW4]MDQ2069476.1 S9 family peptidase [Natronospira sp. AB-CW4]
MRFFHCLALVLGLSLSVHADTIPLEDFVKHNEFRSVALSPDGRHLAVAAPAGDQTGLAILDISDPERMQATASMRMRRNEHVAQVFWVNNERVLFTTNREAGTLYQPMPTGRIFGIDVDGGNQRLLFGNYDGDYVMRRANVVSLLPDEPRHILLQSQAFGASGAELKPRVMKLDVLRGRTTVQDESPLDNGGVIADQEGVVRFAHGSDEEGNAQYAYRESKDSLWREFESDFEANSLSVFGFGPEGRGIYLSTREADRMGLYRLDTKSGEAELLIAHDNVEIGGFASLIGSDVLWDRSGQAVIGAVIEDGRPQMHFVDPEEETSRIQRAIARAFPGQFARVVSFAREADRAIVQVDADILPAGWYLFDLESMAARFLLDARPWVNPELMQPMEPIRLEARDGLELHGYLTRPRGAEEDEAQPMVVVVHGGPHGPRDFWRYDPEVQLLAHHGYAVLQVNFRGSGGYGKAFEEAGYREWGAAMQDDVTDATLWAIEQGIADPERICIYGGSYGGYATAMGLVREPDLYACGAANVGVYDLPLMFEEGDIPQRPQGVAYLRRVLGTDEAELQERSPARRADEITAPLYLAHGEEDIRAHIAHFHFFMEQLDEAGVDYESRLFENEGHGYYKVENRKTYYQDLLDFFARHIGD